MQLETRLSFLAKEKVKINGNTIGYENPYKITFWLGINGKSN